MAFFKNMMQILTGKTNELDKPVFAKPYKEKTDDLLVLANRLDAAPEDMKPVFRDAMSSLGNQIKSHRQVYELLEKSDLPIVVLYDLHLVSNAGSVTIDYVILSNRYLLAVSCPSPAIEYASEPLHMTMTSGIKRRLSPAEHAVDILTELLRENRFLGKREMELIWPVTVIPSPEDASVTADFSVADTDQSIDNGQRGKSVSSDQLIAFLKDMFKLDGKNMTFIPNDKVFAVAKFLVACEENTVDEKMK